MAARRDAKAAARRFLAGFVRYEIGDTNATVLKALRQASTSRLSQTLLDQPVRRPLAAHFPTAGRVGRIVLYGPVRNRMKAVVALRRGGHRGRLELTLRKEAGRWRIDELG